MTWAPPAAPRSPTDVFLLGLSNENTRSTYSKLLRSCAQHLLDRPDAVASDVRWWECGAAELETLKHRMLTAGLSPGTVNSALVVVRGVIRCGWRLGLVPVEQLERVRDVKSIKHRSDQVGQYVDATRVSRIANHLREGDAGTRDRAMLACARLGLRRSEITGLVVSDWTADGLLVMGKGRAERLVPVPHRLAVDIDRWVELRCSYAPEGWRAKGPMFLPLNGRGTVVWSTTHLRGSAVATLLAGAARRAGDEGVRPHDLRRTFITDVLDHGSDVIVAAGLVGHQSTDTTRRYDRRGADAAVDAVERLGY